MNDCTAFQGLGHLWSSILTAMQGHVLFQEGGFEMLLSFLRLYFTIIFFLLKAMGGVNLMNPSPPSVCPLNPTKLTMAEPPQQHTGLRGDCSVWQANRFVEVEHSTQHDFEFQPRDVLIFTHLLKLMNRT